MPETTSDHSHHGHPVSHGGSHATGHGNGHSHGGHHAAMGADFRRRFWVSLALTVPVVLLSPMIQSFLGVKAAWHFPGDRYLQFAFASAIFFYGGWPFLRGLVDELRGRQPGMMTLIGLAIGVAYGYSATVTF